MISVCAYLVVGLLVLIAVGERVRWIRESSESERSRSNHRVRLVYDDAGCRWYPHELADGRVRWYKVSGEDAVDL